MINIDTNDRLSRRKHSAATKQRDSKELRIIIEPSDYYFVNFGDMAMMEVGIKRLSRLLPSAQLFVFTNCLDSFPDYGDNVTPVSTQGRSAWLDKGALIPHRARKLLIPTLYNWLISVEGLIRWHNPGLFIRLIRLRNCLSRHTTNDIDEFFEMMTTSDALVATGGGGITDSFPFFNEELLRIFHLAQKFDLKTAMFGQGVGPLENSGMRKLAKRVLPKLNIMSVREKLKGPELLQSLGVRNENIFVTGDDAIDLAFRERPTSVGRNIGINIRSSDYSEVTDRDVMNISAALVDLAVDWNATLLPVPISKLKTEADLDVIKRMEAEHMDSRTTSNPPMTSLDVVQLAKDCRLVITGSYHAAVFALSMGIPAICLAKSQYYKDKFYGLRDQFGAGVTVIELDQNLREPCISSAAHELCNSQLCEPSALLLAKAKEQIEKSMLVYERFSKLLGK